MPRYVIGVRTVSSSTAVAAVRKRSRTPEGCASVKASWASAPRARAQPGNRCGTVPWAVCYSSSAPCTRSGAIGVVIMSSACQLLAEQRDGLFPALGVLGVDLLEAASPVERERGVVARPEVHLADEHGCRAASLDLVVEAGPETTSGVRRGDDDAVQVVEVGHPVGEVPVV